MKRKQPQPSEPLDVAARALRYRDRSRRQIDERLARAGVEDDQRADALTALERIGYVDDARFAGQRASSLADRGYGDEAIRALLAADGVAPDVAGEAVGASAGGRAGGGDRCEPGRVAPHGGTAGPEGLR
jgi:SOS response regulatory protein OraA/RecX